MKIRNLDLSENTLNTEHSELGVPPLEDSVTHPSSHPILNIAMWLAGLTMVVLILLIIGRFFLDHDWDAGMQLVTSTFYDRLFWSAVGVGLLAQTIDGALGMAYGITSTTFLLSTGVSPAVASASVHIAEIFTTGVSGISHAKLGNVDRKLFLKLLIPGIIGAVTGAIFVSSIDGKILKPYISGYLLLMGIYIISKVFRKIKQQHEAPRHVTKLALFGGFVDAVGGGGWGPVVTTTLVGTGHNPRTTIGSVNFAEFFLTLASAASFMILVGDGAWLIVAGLVIGGLFAAPLAALLVQRLNTRALLAMVGTLITLVSLFNLYKALA